MIGSIAWSRSCPLEGADHEREPVLAVSSPIVSCGSSRRSLENPGLAKPVTLIGLEIERADVVEDEAGRARRACAAQARDRRCRHAPCAYSGRRRSMVRYGAA